MTVRDLARALDTRAPEGQKADFDRVGLHVGDPAAEVTGVVVALDLTADVVAEAVEVGANVVVTHHPLLFKPVGRVTADDPVGGLVWRLARAGVAHIAVHTNLDAAADGVSVALAAQLGLADVRVLAPLDAQSVPGGSMRLVVTYVPPEAAGAVREALARAGAGQIGDYAGCSFSSEGTGRFLPEDGAAPHTGTVGQAEATAEERIEAVVPAWRARAAVAALRAAHPYEEPVVLVQPVEGVAPREGYGALGTLPEPLAQADFLALVAERLGTSALRHTDGPETIARVAVCGGAGLSFLPAALAARADAFVTADVTYHRFFEALDVAGHPRLLLVDAGHYETEAVAERLLADAVAEAFPDLPVRTTRRRTSPMRLSVYR